MPDFKPFRAVRPPRDRAHLVGSRSYINYSDDGLRDKLKGNPYTFLHVIMPETKYDDFKNLELQERFGLVKKEYRRFLKKKYLLQDETPNFYLYRQTKKKNQYIGIIGGIASCDYDNGLIKKHEQTLTKREALFKKYLETTSFNAEPVLLAYQDSEVVNRITEKVLSERPEYEFFTTDKVKHELWVINDKARQGKITEEIKKIGALYIADGHHRSASSALLSRECLKEEESQKSHFMAMLIPKSSLKIFEYNRVIKDLNGLSVDDFIQKLSQEFKIKKLEKAYNPKKKHAFGMYIDNSWYRIKLKKSSLESGIIEQLDTYLLTHKILTPILGIKDLKTDNRAGFISGVDGLDAIQHAVNNKNFKIGFTLFPASFEDLKKVSDANLTMPPKSTWIEPKLRSGLTIYNLMD